MIPSSAFAPCAFCPRPAGLWREITGWDHPREQGGQNHVTLRQETGRRACDICMLDLRNGVAPGSPHLF